MRLPFRSLAEEAVDARVWYAAVCLCLASLIALCIV